MNHIIYHNNCFDGMASAWIAARFFRQERAKFELYAVNHGDLPPMDDLNENPGNIFILDFSWPKPIMEALSGGPSNILVLDHHKTAEKTLSELKQSEKFRVVFDNNESGASLTWKYFYPGERVPAIVEYIKDRDLWLFKMAHSREINSFIQSHPMTVDSYENVHGQLESYFESCKQQGEAIERYKNTMVDKMCKEGAYLTVIGNHEVPSVNASMLFSEVGHRLCELYPRSLFSHYWFKRADGTIVNGLRSIGDFDVSEIAKLYGGGGHKNAAGYQVEGM